VEKFLAAQREFGRDDLRQAYPSRYHIFLKDDGVFFSLPHESGSEGFFAARLVRRESP
jgi:16S rRNA C967 or C1407 C5-methylase (RsmB/RsmF family)